MKLKLVSGT